MSVVFKKRLFKGEGMHRLIIDISTSDIEPQIYLSWLTLDLLQALKHAVKHDKCNEYEVLFELLEAMVIDDETREVIQKD